ncbi:hypothetical protein KI387_033180 [Taxus chinensis]|uniref:Uncharacterized protein n=1 Tax=Taxus chinensis TaxID=29808 RepID=A0AA38BXA9_TAXCH|nr:hypothetical protein KI387_033180 [Taxus chinensis]
MNGGRKPSMECGMWVLGLDLGAPLLWRPVYLLLLHSIWVVPTAVYLLLLLAREIYAMLEKISWEMKVAGYLSDSELVLSERESKMQKRTSKAFVEHFIKEGLTALVEYNENKIFDVKLKEVKAVLMTLITENTDIDEVIETVKQHHKESKLPHIEIVRLLQEALMDAVQWSGKNQQKNANSALRQVLL